jgi:hypothetical protein
MRIWINGNVDRFMNRLIERINGSIGLMDEEMD